MIMYDLANMKGTNIFMRIAIEGMDVVGKTMIVKERFQIRIYIT